MQKPNEKSEKYRRLSDGIKDEEHRARYLMVQNLFDGCRKTVIKQQSAVSHIIVCSLAQNPQNPSSKERFLQLTPAERLSNCAHMLMEGLPGTAKTVLCNSFAGLFRGATFNRIQGRPDMLPSEILGIEFKDKDGQWSFVKGPIFSNVLLADEINRNTPKTQSALLEGMAEGQVTPGILFCDPASVPRTMTLPRPFFVIATENPIEHGSVYVLPEAQKDRFAMLINMTGISVDDVMGVVEFNQKGYIENPIEPVMSVNDWLENILYIHGNVTISPAAIRYAARLAKALVFEDDLAQTDEESDKEFLAARDRAHEAVVLIAGGKSWRVRDIVEHAMYPRMAIVMVSCAKPLGFLRQRLHVTFDDIDKVFLPTGRHRIFLKSETEGLLQGSVRTPDGKRLTKIRLTDMTLRTIQAHMAYPVGEPAYDPR